MPAQAHKPRIAVSQAAILRSDGGPDVSCTIVDVSADGFRLKVPGAVRVGCDYTLQISDREHPVAIRWASLGEVGGQFLD